MTLSCAPDLASCALCGDEIPGIDGTDIYADGEMYTCRGCQAVHRADYDDDEKGMCLDLYKCRHNRLADVACDLCEIEDGAGVGEP